jgi:hypothetical protein
MSNFTKIHLAVPELLHADRQRDRYGKTNRWIFATLYCEQAKNYTWVQKAIIFTGATSPLLNLLLYTGKVLTNTAPIKHNML